jgi:EAL and modified HD-GYP domain-containing signal transduction protein
LTEIKSDASAALVSIARQPVFDEKGRLWGYELFSVGSAGAVGSGFPGSPDAAITVEPSAYFSLHRILQSEKKIIIDFSEKNILNRFPYALPPALAVIKVGEEAGREQDVVKMLRRNKEDGYLIAIRNFTGLQECEELYNLADIISIETGRKGRNELAMHLDLARKYKATLLASRVQDRNLYDACKSLGFSLFHGAFFKASEKITIRKLSSNEFLRLKLLQLIEDKEQDIAKLTQTIQSDATISFRLLSYLNSAAFAFSRKIGSIQQAITLLGWANIKNWLRVVLLTDISQSKNAQELVLLSAQRGMFLERLARDHDFWGFNPESLHLLGIFSLLDALLGLPMSEAIQYLPLENKMKAALRRESNNEFLPLLNLAQCLEEARWEDADAMILQLNLSSKKTMAAFQDSVHWATQISTIDIPQ